MEVQEIQNLLLGGGGILLLAMTIVQITPIKINPWSWLAKKIGNALNGEVMQQIEKSQAEIQTLRAEYMGKFEELKNDINNLREECNEREVTLCRTRILRFGDDIMHGKQYSKEHFDQIMLDISSYEKYCDSHPEYVNHIAVTTIQYIKDTYLSNMENKTFL